MSSKTKTSFTIEQPIDQVWEQITDLASSLYCVPHLRVIRPLDTQQYEAEAKANLSFVQSKYLGKIGIEHTDRNNYQLTLRGEGEDPRRKDKAAVQVDCQLSPRGAETSINTNMRVDIMNKPAAYNEQHVNYAVGQLLQAFAKNFEQSFPEKKRTETPPNQDTLETFARVNAINTATDAPPAELINNHAKAGEKSLLQRIAQFFSF
jgi:carbon monoxide dehydrogenase subunit G